MRTTEPVRLAASVQALIAAVITLLSVFNVWSPTQDQLAAVLGVYAIAAPLVAGILVRRKVTPALDSNVEG